VSDNINPIKTLIEAGLTPNQAKLYLCLLKVNTATVSALSKETKFARQEVYRVLQELHGIGLVNKIISNPTQFEAVPIQEGASLLLSQKITELEETKIQVQSLINEYYVEKQGVQTQEYKFHLIPAKKIANEPANECL
jgi:sugar-specific transcriptional regulator TrmB